MKIEILFSMYFQISQQKIDELFEIQKKNDMEFHNKTMENEMALYNTRMEIEKINKETAEIRRKIAQKDLEKIRNQSMYSFSGFSTFKNDFFSGILEKSSNILA